MPSEITPRTYSAELFLENSIISLFPDISFQRTDCKVFHLKLDPQTKETTTSTVI
jgi:hypothetical protein